MSYYIKKTPKHENIYFLINQTFSIQTTKCKKKNTTTKLGNKLTKHTNYNEMNKIYSLQPNSPKKKKKKKL